MAARTLDTPVTQPPPAALEAARPLGRAGEAACRLLDVSVAATALAACSPLLALAAVAIRVDSPGPVLFRQRRLGHRLTPFTVYKLRTMRADTSAEPHRAYVASLIDTGRATPPAGDTPLYKLADDDRVTRAGRLLRRWSIDELPQLWNVLRGDMSLVGPRPAIEYEVEHYPPDWFARFAVKPGVTGLWQVSGRNRLTFEEMVRLDVEYAKRRSPALNLRILARTGWVVLHGRGAA
jgi:lipopolysaccharide/colanic/teichoic acid biosynthesis glycosyltransferase